jgi:hypothetical protein
VYLCPAFPPQLPFFFHNNFSRRSTLKITSELDAGINPAAVEPKRSFTMVKKIALALLFSLCLMPAASFAQGGPHERPPAPVVERRGAPPEHGMVWTPGYHRWEHDHYVWTPGRWDRPPHPHAVWVAHHWENHHGEWVLIEGHWR